MRPSPRTQPAKPALSRESVLEAGLRVLRARGIDGVTMRAVAGELETGAASLYVYFPNRKALLDAMFDEVAGAIDVSEKPDPARWREQLTGVLTRIVETMDAHPGIARVPLANPPTGPNSARIAEYVLALLAAGGVHDRSAAWFLDVVFLFVNATAYETTIFIERGEREGDLPAALERQFAQLDPVAFPNFSRMRSFITKGSGEERFAFGLRLMIEGLLHVDPPTA
ncbi:MAG TPA: TetR/AcrR family transcriptional regulator [Solirubrobacteraceae bacterium]|jgi:AcrR family transcriptional regulator